MPCNNGFSIRHTTRNFERREGSKPSDKQIASVALMDARSIAATAANGGVLTTALGLDFDDEIPKFEYNPDVYASRVYNGYGKADSSVELVYGPNITDIPHIEPMKTTSHSNFAVSSTIPSPLRTNLFRRAKPRLIEAIRCALRNLRFQEKIRNTSAQVKALETAITRT